MSQEFVQGEFIGLRSRKITEETCRHMGYTVAKFKGQPAQFANYYDRDGKLIAQKVRLSDPKDFRVIGNIKDALPFGAHAWPNTGKKLVITEGEVDALAVSQAQGNKWPVVSIACGADAEGSKANGIRKYIAKHRDYLLGFEEVIIMFDMDGPGQTSARAAAEVLGPKAKIAKLPGAKDAAEMLEQNRVKELVDAIWRAEQYRPEGIVDLATKKEEIREAPKMGLSWWCPTLTEYTRGKRLGEIMMIGAGTGVGKTDFLTQDTLHMVHHHKEKVGIFSFEQSPRTTALRMVGKHARLPLHTPEGWDEAAFDKAWDEVMIPGQVFAYDSMGVNDWDAVEAKIEFLAHAYDVRWIYLDNLSGLIVAADDERREVENIMGRMSTLVNKLQIHVTCVTHLATPEKGSHEEGSAVSLRQFKGSRAIAALTNQAIGLERNQQSPNDIIRNTTRVRILKDRVNGDHVGKVFHIYYDHATGLLTECAAPNPDAPQTASDYGFEKEDAEGASDF